MSQASKKPVVYWPIEKLIPYEKNAKRHDPAQVAKIAAAIREVGFGQSHAIVLDKDGVIIAGHGRRLAAISLNMKEVPVVVRDDLTDEQVRAYRLFENKVSESTYDTELMAEELSQLVLGDDFNMSDFFDDRELNFAIEDLGALDDGALTLDLAAQVDEHSQSTQNLVDSEDERTVAISKIFGFSQVTTSQSRVLARLLALAEGQTDMVGANALCAYATEHMGL